MPLSVSATGSVSFYLSAACLYIPRHAFMGARYETNTLEVAKKVLVHEAQRVLSLRMKVDTRGLHGVN